VIVCFCGGRDYSNRAMVEFVVDLLIVAEEQFGYEDAGVSTKGLHIRVGDCPTGLDHIVLHTPQARAKVYTALWHMQGKAAGPIRNGVMLRGEQDPRVKETDDNWMDKYEADLLIAFPGGKGTADCVRQARELGIPVLEVPQ
jgi:hypothetical protein